MAAIKGMSIGRSIKTQPGYESALKGITGDPRDYEKQPLPILEGPEDTSPVLRELARLTYGHDNLRARLVVLLERLEPIMGPPQLRPMSGDKCSEVPSLLVLNLQAKVQTIEILDGMVEEMIDRLEI